MNPFQKGKKKQVLSQDSNEEKLKKNDSRIYQKLFCFVNENIIPLFYAA